MNRTLWFRLWVAASEGIVRVQRFVLGKPVGRADAHVRLWIAERLSWVYHRCLDLAALGLEKS